MVDIGAVRLRLNELSQLFIGLLERSCPDIRSVDNLGTLIERI